MIGLYIGYPIGTPNRVANRVRTNPPSRPDPYLKTTNYGWLVGPGRTCERSANQP